MVRVGGGDGRVGQGGLEVLHNGFYVFMCILSQQDTSILLTGLLTGVSR